MPDKPDYNLPKQTNYETSFAMARDRLSSLDFDLQCRKAGVETDSAGALVPFLNRTFRIDRQGFDITAADDGAEPELWERIIALHYLISADGKPDTGELITYKQVPDGAPYYDVFNRRTGGILLSVFGSDFPRLKDASARLGGEEISGHGDLCLKLRALPRVAYLFVCYEADEEFPADVKVLFDSSIMSYLPAEDITVLCQMACIAMARFGWQSGG